MTAQIEIGLTAAIVTVEDETPLILAVRATDDPVDGLPFGPFDPFRHRTLEVGLRSWVEEQTTLRLGYAEQLYTFGDRGRHAVPGDTGPHVMSVGYLALASPGADAGAIGGEASWRSWYGYFPWEDWRGGRPAILDGFIIPALTAWAASAPGDIRPRPLSPRNRVQRAFAVDGAPWDEEKVLDRYELLYEAGLVEEARRDGRAAAAETDTRRPLGTAMRFDHRRILATAIERLRGKMKYRPVGFELISEDFTLTGLQRLVEAISGRHLHKQNFRRLVEQSALVEPTGATTSRTGGRPARLFRFRRDVLAERPFAGFRVGLR